MFKIFVAGAAICAFSISAFAQENLVGKWGGSYQYASAKGQISINVDLDITSVEGNVVKGVAKHYSRGGCAGEFQMRGKLDGSNLGIASTEAGGPAGDCKFGFRVAVEGNKMTGKIGPNDLVLNKK